MTTPAPSRDLTSRVAAIATEPLPLEVIARARHLLLDHVTCVLVGRQLEHLRPHLQMADINAARRSRINPTHAAFSVAYTNGMAANALDLDDTLLGHPSATIISSALAVAEREGCTYDTLLRGIIAGHEAHWLLASAARPTASHARHVRGTSAWATVAAALAIAVITGRPPQDMPNIINLACAHASISYVAKWYERPVPTVKNNLGWAAAAAVLATDLAAAGSHGITNALDGPAGMWRMTGSNRWQWAMPPWSKMPPAVLRVGFKRYPACWHLQGYLHTAHQLIQHTEPNALRSIEISGPQSTHKFMDPHITHTSDVAFSLPTLLKLLLTDQPPGPAWAEPTKIRAAIQRPIPITWRHGKRRVTLVDSQGRQASQTVSPNDEDNPYNAGLQEDQVRHKCQILLGAALGRSHAASLECTIMNPPVSKPLAPLLKPLPT